MKWTPPSERTQFWLFSPIIIPAALLCAPAFLVVGGFSLLGERVRRLFGPTAEWSRWYAWRPVRVNDWFDPCEGQWIWLEAVERRLDRGLVEVRPFYGAPS